jgi:hypothetical protein
VVAKKPLVLRRGKIKSRITRTHGARFRGPFGRRVAKIRQNLKDFFGGIVWSIRHGDTPFNTFYRRALILGVPLILAGFYPLAKSYYNAMLNIYFNR